MGKWADASGLRFDAALLVTVTKYYKISGMYCIFSCVYITPPLCKGRMSYLRRHALARGLRLSIQPTLNHNSQLSVNFPPHLDLFRPIGSILLTEYNATPDKNKQKLYILKI